MTAAEDYLEFLAPDDIRIRGHRHGIENILYQHIHKGRTAEQIAQTYPTLNLAEIYAVLFYYHTHREAIHQYMTDWLDFSFRARQEQQQDPRFQALRNRLRALKEKRADGAQS